MIDSMHKPVKSNSKRWLVVPKVITTSVLTVCLLFPFSTNTAEAVSKDLKVHTVVIDPGHGGHDSGCIGYGRSNEKHIALKIALLLGEYIEKNIPDVKVIYTRKTDVFVELEERAAIANRNNADLFISIHCNAASPAAFGTETYVMGLHKSEGNLSVAMRENSVIELEENYEERYAFDPSSPESYIILSLTQNAYIEQSTKLAAKIQQQFTERVGRHNRGVKSAGFWVLWRTAMPAVLIETGFLTNQKEEAFLNSTEGQEYMASAIFRAFREYKEEVEQTANQLQVLNQHAEEVPEKKVPAAVVETPVNSPPYGGDTGVTYRVQLLVSSKKYDTYNKKFQGVEPLLIEKINGGLYRYSAGPFKQEKDAVRSMKDVAALGFTDAFISVYKGNERVQILKP